MAKFEEKNVNQTFGGAWTREKIRTLTGYLTAYNTALKNQNFKKIYIDGFSGSGSQEIRIGEEFESIVGSAICALQTVPAFEEYIFVEKNQSFMKKLQGRVEKDYSNKVDSIKYYNNDFNAIINNITESINWKSSRAVLFIDPYATELNWNSLKVISQTKAIDVWYLFPLSAITRMLPNNQIPKKANDIFERIFGTHEWQDELYTQSNQLSLFDEQESESFRVSQDDILMYAKSRYETVFPFVSNSRVLYNSKGSPLFALFFFCSNPKPAARNLSSRMADHLLKMNFDEF
ncbi:MAG: three-Cys-motif partner protein TcmP [Alcaligenaceae bacterium]|nr:three-Cys-motif partner protein TcmP [Alcaligenaceae bacterium]